MLLFTPLPKSGNAVKITRFAMHRNGKNVVSRRETRDFRAKYARKHLAGHYRVKSNTAISRYNKNCRPAVFRRRISDPVQIRHSDNRTEPLSFPHLR